MSDVHTQDPSATLDWTMSWAKQLTEIDIARASVDLGLDPEDITDALLADWRTTHARTTLTAATVVCPTTGTTITSVTPAATAVTWRLATTNVPLGTTLTLTVHVTMSTGAQDERDMLIHILNT